ncbi:MAG: AMP-binding protein [Candidatus Pacearchaeota archaeon]
MESKFWKKQERKIVMHGSDMNIIESCVDRHALFNPNKTAFVFQSYGKVVKYSYKEIYEKVNQFANLLENSKVKKNSRVFVFLPKVPEMYISILAVIKQGSIAAPLFEAFQTDGLELRLRKGDADVLITNKLLAKRLKHKIKGMKVFVVDSQIFKNKLKKQSSYFNCVLKNKKSTALMMFTSSTAGTPVAGVEISHYGLVQQHYTAELVLRLNKQSNYWCTAHPGWVTGTIYGLIAPLSIGCTNYVLEEHFDAKMWIGFLKKNNITTLYTAPTALRLLNGNVKKSDFKHLKVLASVGEALTESTFNSYKKLGIRITDTYWQTETGAMVIANYDSSKFTMGKAIPGLKVLINKGTIALRPKWPSMMTGIYKHKKMYRSYFKNKLFITNDTAKKDKKGYFYFIARSDDIIKTSGERVSPIEIESVLLSYKSIKEAAVIGVPDEIKGSILKAFIVLKDKVKESDKLKMQISEFVKKYYAGHSYPKIIEFVKSLPKTNSGKIIRMKLREMES